MGGHLTKEEKIAVIVGVELSRSKTIPLEESMAELKRLCATADIEVVGEISQKRDRPDGRYYIGTGKIEELKALLAEKEVGQVIFDVELSPAQQRNLEKELGKNVSDRTELIIDIFSQHARSREGKIQVELAQLTYELPRLRGMWGHLHRQRGGIGMRDVGEQQLELDKRIIRKKMGRLNKEIEQVKKSRALQRAKRKSGQITTISLIGYTNSGKSTLLNTLTKADVLAEDKLFATLDPTTRRAYLPNNKVILFSDTVGFIQKLPHQLVAAFRATLDEIKESDLLLHVVDISNPYFEDQINAVYTVLEELGGINKKMITVFNKIDQLEQDLPQQTINKYQPSVALSALTGEGIPKLLDQLS